MATATSPHPDLVAVVLAAGFGTRLRPLTHLRSKALCPLGGSTLLDRALDSVAPYAGPVAVNAHHLHEQVTRHCARRGQRLGVDIEVSVELPKPLGSAGALARLRPWIAGRAVLVRNADAYLQDDLHDLVAAWDFRTPRVLVQRQDSPADFGHDRYVGACLLPTDALQRLPECFGGLYDRVWAPAAHRGELERIPVRGEVVDCGTPADYLRANLLASGGAPVIGAGAHVAGRVESAVVWPGAFVGSGESLRDCIRAGRSLTVHVDHSVGALRRC